MSKKTESKNDDPLGQKFAKLTEDLKLGLAKGVVLTVATAATTAEREARVNFAYDQAGTKKIGKKDSPRR